MNTRRMVAATCAVAMALTARVAVAEEATPTEPSRFAEVNAAVAAGDGAGPGTAYPVPGFLWEPALLQYRRLRFVSLRKDEATGLDVMTARTSDGNEEREIWFKPGTPENPEHGRMDAMARDAMGSGNGKTPETAFFVAGEVAPQYAIMRFMGFAPRIQSLVRIRGCMFDRHAGTYVDTKQEATVYFALGAQGKPCILAAE